jgi:exportin-T
VPGDVLDQCRNRNLAMTPEELEHVVLLASNATNLQNQQQANALLNHWVSSTEDQVQADALLPVLRVSQKEVVLFFVLTAFLKLRNTTFEQRAKMRQELLWLLMKEECWTPTYLRTKAGVLFATFIQLDYANGNWPNAFEELQDPELLRGAPDILLRTLVALMESFGHNETAAIGKVKDMMRGYAMRNEGWTQVIPSAESLSAQLLKTICSLLFQSLKVCNENFPPYQLQICVLALMALKGFMAWIDLSLVLDDPPVLNMIFTTLAKGSTTDSPMADAGVVAVECLQELISRGMEEEKKVAILVHTNMLETIHICVDLQTLDASPIDVVLEVARFVDLTGLEVTPILFEQNGSPDHARVRSQLLDLFFRCFAFDDIDVSGAVISLAGSLIPSQDKVQQQVSLSDPVLSQLLSVTFRQMRYPEDFQFDYEDEDEAEEEMYRTELRKLNQKFIRAAPDAFLQFICQTWSHLPTPLSAAPTRDVEAALRLVYHYCEGIRPPPGMKVVMRNETFRSLIAALHTSDIAMHPHREVICLYYETAVRYYPLLKQQPELLQKVLESLSGSRGLNHEHPRVRSRCCYMLLRLVKSAGNSSNDSGPNVMRPYVETAVSGIQALLHNKSLLLRSEDTLNLFETIGLLLGKTGVDPAEQQRFLSQVMTPHIRSIQQVLDRKDVVAQDPDTYGEILSSSIAAIASLSKGFKRPQEPVQVVLLETLHFTVNVLEALSSVAAVRNKTMVLMQRLIQCLEEKVVPVMPRVLHLLILQCTQEDVLDVAQLYNQLSIKFKERSIPLIDAALVPFLQKCYALASDASTSADGTAATTAPHQVTEQLSIHKLTYMVLNNIACNQASGVLYTPTNLPSLEGILMSMSEGATRVEDVAMKKHCLIFFKEILEKWVDPALNPRPPPSVVQGFIQFIYDVLMPDVFESFAQPTFSVHDANNWRCVLEVAAMIDILREKVPDVYQQHMLVGLFSQRLGYPPSVVASLAAASERKAIEASLKAMLDRR